MKKNKIFKEGYQPKKNNLEKGYNPKTPPKNSLEPPPPTVSGNKEHNGSSKSSE
jgi:hypothetical protein